MEETEVYENLGLKFLNEKGKIKVVHLNGKHTQYEEGDIHKYFLPFLWQ